MFTTENVRGELTTDNILRYISEEDIFRKYIGHDFNLGESFCSPLRDDDNNPSFNVYYNEGKGKLYYNDFARGGGDVFTFVQNMFHLDFTSALRKINEDFNLGLGIYRGSKIAEKLVLQPKVVVEPTKKQPVVFDTIRREFNEKDLMYWKSFGITKEILQKYNVFAVQQVFKNKYLFWNSTEYQPIYEYFFPRTGNKKIYRPFGSKFSKWRTNATNEQDIQGYDQLPKQGEIIVFTKAMKDVMTLYSMNVNAVASQAEGNYINPDFIRHIKGRFTKLYSLYDRDEAGMKFARYLWKEHGIIPLFTPKKSNTKDISDFYKAFGQESTKELIKKLIK